MLREYFQFETVTREVVEDEILLYSTAEDFVAMVKAYQQVNVLIPQVESHSKWKSGHLCEISPTLRGLGRSRIWYLLP